MIAGRIVTALALAATMALVSACGRKAGLDTPYEAAVQARKDALKAKGICRYTGITTTFKSAYAATEAIIKREKPDFLLIDYAIDNRDVEARILPACQDAGTAVLIALPFGRGRLFRTALGKQLPEWAAEFDCASWGQFFLKFLLAHPAVHAVAPGTSKAQHMIDNLGAGRGRLRWWLARAVWAPGSA